jgi:HK97 family phage portal protein
VPILASLERRMVTAHPSDPNAVALLGGGMVSTSGQLVTADTAMRVMAVYRAVRLLSQTLASLPLRIYQVMGNGALAPAEQHPFHELLAYRPNKWQTPFEWKEQMQGHLELRGNGYSELIKDGRGRVREMIPLHPDRVYPKREFVPGFDEEVQYYEFWPRNGPMRVIYPDEMLHLRGYSADGLIGISPIAIARETIGLAMAAEEHASRFFSNNGSPGGVLSTPKAMDEDAKKRLKKSWEAAHSGSRNAHRVAVLEDGLEWKQIGLDNKDAQFIENRKFQIREIARMFDLPPHKLMDMEQATFSNIEHQSMEFVQDAIRPRIVRWEEAMLRDCLLPSDEGKYVLSFNLDALLRGDSAARAAFYKELFYVGAFSPNDVLRREGQNPYEGGDERFVPVNMQPISRALTAPAPELVPQPGEPAKPAPKAEKKSKKRRSVRFIANVHVDQPKKGATTREIEFKKDDHGVATGARVTETPTES